jgi:hypothetical protein
MKGVDLSARQVELARSNVSSAALIQASMTEIDFTPGSINHPRAPRGAASARASHRRLVEAGLPLRGHLVDTGLGGIRARLDGLGRSYVVESL